MPGPSLEVADIFRAHGAAWCVANAPSHRLQANDCRAMGHISLNQFKVMSAIERCRTAALGGHIARCTDCAHEHIAYNSCRNRHCPKCQAGAAKAWLAAREAELLPVLYFHLVFTLPKPIADIAHQNKREIYNLLMRASADTVVKIAADPKHLGAKVGITSVLHTWGSAMTHHPHVHMIVPGGGAFKGWFKMDRQPQELLPVCPRSIPLVSAAHSGRAGQAAHGRETAILRRSRKPCRSKCLRRFPQTTASNRLGRLRQRTLRRAEGGAGVPVALHPQGGNIQQPLDPL